MILKNTIGKIEDGKGNVRRSKQINQIIRTISPKGSLIYFCLHCFNNYF